MVRPKCRQCPENSRLYSQSEGKFKSHVQICVCLLQTGLFVISFSSRGTSTSFGRWGEGVGCGSETNSHVSPENSWRN